VRRASRVAGGPPGPPAASQQASRAQICPKRPFFAFLQQLMSVGGLSEVGEAGCVNSLRECVPRRTKSGVPKG